ncbi:LOW QUALITY PROTEIN: RNA polymerase II-associated protein 3 [Drosophila subobscura]|uniref:LOW QUALITY PROTEIN: RNA polymerase II-associated protein 3 n=1 Tax=Drosophila subobscura TaxID=7241 RepID=UPI00155AD9DE|nr:LOW QUALITY PROTEIN: RNA polymerase II-associated protein 3 [Drosophila subobscura]
MSAENAFEMQRQVRRNAKELQSSLKDLYSWEKDIKNQEMELKTAPAAAANIKMPVRSHVQKTGETDQQSGSSSASDTPTEKKDPPGDPVARQHKKANDIKDRGNNYVKQGEYDRAIEAYTEAVEAYPYDPVYFINRALCYLKQERFDSCVDDCEAAIGLDKLCVKAYYRRMQANESLGNNMEALKDCTTVLAIDPKNIEAKQSLVRINERLRKNATKNGPNFSAERPDLIDILPIEKPVYKRSKQSMQRVTITDIVSPRPSTDEAQPLRISDDDIDKIFNSYCGPYTEIKKGDLKTNPKTPPAKPIVESVDSEPLVQDTSNEVKPSAAPTKTSQVPSNDTKQTVADAVKEAKQSANHQKNIQKSKQRSSTEVKPSQNTSKDSKLSTNTKKDSPIDGSPNSSETSSKVQANKPKIESASKTLGGAAPLERALPPAPSGTAQFYITWKELSAMQKYQYLKSIQIQNLCKILGAGFDSDTFNDLLCTVQDYYVPEKEPTTASVLLEISKNDEFPILAMLMSNEEKKMVSSILNKIKNWPKTNPQVLEKLSRAYGVD